MPAQPSSSWSSATADRTGRLTGRGKGLRVSLVPQMTAFWEKPGRTAGTSTMGGTQQATRETFWSLQSFIKHPFLPFSQG